MTASSNERSSLKDIGESSKLSGEARKLIVHKDDLLKSDLLPGGRESLGKNPYVDKYNNYIAPLMKGNSNDRNSIHHGNFSGSPFISDNHRHKARIATSGTTLADMFDSKSGVVLNDRRSSDLSFSHPRHPSSVGLSSRNTNTLGTLKLFESNLEHRASLSSSVQLGASPFSYYRPGSLSWNHMFKEPSNYKSSYDWEPSLPFRPSHVITINLLSKGSLYDPIHESIEQTKVRDWLAKSSNSGQDSSMMNAHMQSKNSEEEKLLTYVNAGETGKCNLLSSSDDNRLNLDIPKDQTEVKADEFHRNPESDNDIKKHGHVQNEEKAVKHFQAALIEYVKELVKPTWREGLMSKDAHKLIVKKSVDKVLSTIQPDQVPSTSESIKFYLSSSHSKLAKLVEGYIEKYEKS